MIGSGLLVPLDFGSIRDGWDFGMDVYISTVTGKSITTVPAGASTSTRRLLGSLIAASNPKMALFT